MRLIGLTGTIGSGKSTVAAMLAELGADVIDTDEIARDVVRPGTVGLKNIIENWGDQVLKSDGTLDRERLAQVVFTDEAQRSKLNGILHPLIGVETQKRIAASRADVVVLVVPLLFESGFDRMVQECWVVTADEGSLVERVSRRDGCGADHVRDRIRSQMNQEEKVARAQVVINNSGTPEETRRQVREAWEKIEKL